MNANKAFLEHYDKHNLNEMDSKTLAKIKAAFIDGYNYPAQTIAELKLLIESSNAPTIDELRPDEDLIHDYYQRIVSILFKP
jgi:hypothetical protein